MGVVSLLLGACNTENKPINTKEMREENPVIYLYPEAPMEVSVRVYPTGGFTITEPEYGDGWSVYTDTESNIYDYNTQKYYPYLFWEGIALNYTMPPDGFVIAQKDIATELYKLLQKQGMNDKEIADFMEYWLPKFDTTYPYYFITFVDKEVFDSYAPLEITPKPDTIIRVFMDYKGLHEYKEMPQKELITPIRNGFTVVEWGGTSSDL